MKAPVCRLCKAEHWAREPHVWGKVADAPPDRVERKVKPPKGCQQCAEYELVIREQAEEIVKLAAQLKARPVVTRNQPVVTPPLYPPLVATRVTSVTSSVTKPKRDRAAYMRDRRAKTKET